MPDADAPRPKRERSARYPGVPLPEAIDLARLLDAEGLDGLPAEQIAAAMGYKSVKTNTFSARLSAARQFGLVELQGDGYALTPLARAILHPVDPDGLATLHRQALGNPPLYADLILRLADRKVPEPAVLANLLYHSYQITAAAKLSAAEAFLASARFAGALGADHILRPSPAPSPMCPAPAAEPARPPAAAPPTARTVRFDLRLWGPDEGKTIRVRAPEAMTPASLERFLQALRLHVRIVDDPPPEHS